MIAKRWVYQRSVVEVTEQMDLIYVRNWQTELIRLEEVKKIASSTLGSAFFDWPIEWLTNLCLEMGLGYPPPLVSHALGITLIQVDIFTLNVELEYFIRVVKASRLSRWSSHLMAYLKNP